MTTELDADWHHFLSHGHTTCMFVATYMLNYSHMYSSNSLILIMTSLLLFCIIIITLLISNNYNHPQTTMHGLGQWIFTAACNCSNATIFILTTETHIINVHVPLLSSLTAIQIKLMLETFKKAQTCWPTPALFVSLSFTDDKWQTNMYIRCWCFTLYSYRIAHL